MKRFYFKHSLRTLVLSKQNLFSGALWPASHQSADPATTQGQALSSTRACNKRALWGLREAETDRGMVKTDCASAVPKQSWFLSSVCFENRFRYEVRQTGKTLSKWEVNCNRPVGNLVQT